jgi:hypothetical protein
MKLFFCLFCVFLLLSTIGCGNGKNNLSGNGVDFDLTRLSSPMIIAQIDNMMQNPDIYIGSTIRMSGYYINPESDYHIVVVDVSDPCCSSFMEFIYSDKYPDIDEFITIEGVFESYTWQGDGNTYYRIAAAVCNMT